VAAWKLNCDFAVQWVLHTQGTTVLKSLLSNLKFRKKLKATPWNKAVRTEIR